MFGVSLLRSVSILKSMISLMSGFFSIFLIMKSIEKRRVNQTKRENEHCLQMFNDLFNSWCALNPGYASADHL